MEIAGLLVFAAIYLIVRGGACFFVGFFGGIWPMTLPLIFIVASFTWTDVLSSCAGFLLGFAYAPSYFDGSERTGTRSWPWFRALRFWIVLRAYFGFEGPEIPEEKVLWIVRPHNGFIPVAPVLAFMLVGRPLSGREPFVAVSSLLFFFPVLREIALWSGAVEAGAEVMKSLLAGGRSVALLPGGVAEGIAQTEDRTTFSFEHRGWKRVAEEAGVRVVPAYAEGDNGVWLVLSCARKMRMRLAKIARYPFPQIVVPFPFPSRVRLLAGSTEDDPDEYFEKFSSE